MYFIQDSFLSLVMSKGGRFKGQKIHMDLVFSGGGEGSEFFQPYQFILAEMYLFI